MKTTLLQEPLIAKILRWCVYATALMPLIIFRDYISPFHFGKVIIFRSAVEFLFVLYIILVLRDRSYIPRMNLILWTVVIFAAVFSLTTLTSVVPWASFWGSLERMGGLFTFWHFVVFLWIMISVVRTRAQWRTFLDWTLAVAIFSALYGFGQKTDIPFFIGSGGRERIFGTLGNPALFAGYQIVTLFLALTLLLQPGNSTFRRWLYGSAAGLGILAVMMTVVRGSILGLGAGLILFAALHYLVTRSRRTKLGLMGLAVLAGICLVILVTPLKEISLVRNSAFLSRLTDTSFESRTAKTRFWAWQAGLKGWSESPRFMILGWGPENFNLPFAKHFNPLFFNGFGSETFFDRAHNMFVEVLVTMGIIGFFAYIGIFVQLFRELMRLFRRAPPEKLYAVGLIPLLVAYSIHNSFIFDTSANFLVFFSVVGFIIHLMYPATGENLQPLSSSLVRSSAVRFFMGMLLGTSTAVMLYRANIIPIQANYAVTRGIVRGWSGDFLGAVAKYKEALQYNSFGVYEFRHRLAQYLIEPNNVKFGDNLAEAILLHIEELKKNTIMNPHDYLPELYLSRLYIVLGKGNPTSPYNDQALEHSMRALDLSRTFIRTYYEIAQAYLNKKDYDTAANYFKKAVELNPDTGVSYWYLALVQIEAGLAKADNKQIDEGLQILDIALEKGYKPSEGEYQRLVKPYLDRGDYAHLASIYEALIGLNPEHTDYYTALAYAYAQVGRIEDALTMARKAVMLDPSLLTQAQQFARSLGREL